MDQLSCINLYDLSFKIIYSQFKAHLLMIFNCKDTGIHLDCDFFLVSLVNIKRGLIRLKDELASQDNPIIGNRLNFRWIINHLRSPPIQQYEYSTRFIK